MLLSLPVELQQLILSFLTRKEYKQTVSSKSLLLCKSYLSLRKFSKLKELPKVLLSTKELENLFLKSCESDNDWLVDKLINKFKVDPSLRNNKAIMIASLTGHRITGNYYYNRFKVGKRLLKDSRDCAEAQSTVGLSRPRTDPSVDNNYAIIEASKYGYFEVVEELLKHPNVDPSAWSNNAIREASENGHLEVVETLLKHPNVDPSDCDNYAIIRASQNGHWKIVERLLLDPRVNPSADNNCAIRLASEYDHLEVVDILLQDRRVNPSANNNDAIGLASSRGHLRVVERLLLDPRVNPSDRNNVAIFAASYNGHFRVVIRLLRDYRMQFKRTANGISQPRGNSYSDISMLFMEGFLARSNLNEYVVLFIILLLIIELIN